MLCHTESREFFKRSDFFQLHFLVLFSQQIFKTTMGCSWVKVLRYVYLLSQKAVIVYFLLGSYTSDVILQDFNKRNLYKWLFNKKNSISYIRHLKSGKINEKSLDSWPKRCLLLNLLNWKWVFELFSQEGTFNGINIFLFNTK